MRARALSSPAVSVLVVRKVHRSFSEVVPMRSLKGDGQDYQLVPSGDEGVGDLTLALSTAAHQREVRVGVVGCGYWGAKHVRVLSAVPGVAEIVLIERDQALCGGLQRVFPATRSFRSLEAALPHVDAVVIATPPQTHAE